MQNITPTNITMHSSIRYEITKQEAISHDRRIDIEHLYVSKPSDSLTDLGKCSRLSLRAVLVSQQRKEMGTFTGRAAYINYLKTCRDSVKATKNISRV